ncbi:MAG: hypothetical protein ACYCY7_06410, partial [Gallionella sp.]
MLRAKKKRCPRKNSHVGVLAEWGENRGWDIPISYPDFLPGQTAVFGLNLHTVNCKSGQTDPASIWPG